METEYSKNDKELKLNICKKIFCFVYLINIKRDDRKLSLFTGFASLFVVLFINLVSIIRILCHFFELKYIFDYLFEKKIFLSVAIIYLLITIYISLFKQCNFIDSFEKLSPWKKPIVGGGIYILVSYILCILVLIFF